MGTNRIGKKVAFFGRSRCGKTTTAVNLVKGMLKSKQKKIVIKHDPQNKFNDLGVTTIDIHEVEGLEKYITFEENGKTICRIQNAIFVIDEAQLLFGTGRTPKYLMLLLALASENGNDWIFITHHPKLLPVRVGMYITDFFIFTTGSGAKSFDDERVEASATLMHCMVVLKGYVREFPKGDGGLGVYPDFPFAHIDCDKGSIKFINTPEINITKKDDSISVTYGKIQYY